MACVHQQGFLQRPPRCGNMIVMVSKTQHVNDIIGCADCQHYCEGIQVRLGADKGTREWVDGCFELLFLNVFMNSDCRGRMAFPGFLSPCK
jgi:hypothetical protein